MFYLIKYNEVTYTLYECRLENVYKIDFTHKGEWHSYNRCLSTYHKTYIIYNTISLYEKTYIIDNAMSTYTTLEEAIEDMSLLALSV